MEQPTSSMKIKSYFASSVEQAIQEARQELGTDAMLITSRRSSPETRSLGAYEVVFGLQGTSNPAGARPRASVPSDLSGELQQLRAQLQEIKSTLKGARGPEAPSSEAEELFEELVANDLARNIAQETVSSAVRLREQLSRDQPAHPTTLRAYAVELVSKKLRFVQPFQASPAQPASDAAKVVVFAGPAGAGKTTTLIKLAIRECLAQRQSVRILSVDPQRVAAHEKLRLVDRISERFAGVLEYDQIAGLRKAIDRFFEEVMVMAENEAVRMNRLALLSELLREFTTIADFSEIAADEK